MGSNRRVLWSVIRATITLVAFVAPSSDRSATASTRTWRGSSPASSTRRSTWPSEAAPSSAASLAALAGGEVAGVDELVEPAGGALGGGERGGVGEQLGRGLHVRALRGGCGGDRERGEWPSGSSPVEDPGQQRDRVAVHGLVRAALRGIVDRAGRGDVRGVLVTATRKRDVQRGQRRPRRDHGVAGVGGAALRGVHGRGVGQREVLGDVARGQHEALPERLPSGPVPVVRRTSRAPSSRTAVTS